MEIDEILDYALSLPDTKEAMPFGPDTVVIKHHEKLFLILNFVLSFFRDFIFFFLNFNYAINKLNIYNNLNRTESVCIFKKYY